MDWIYWIHRFTHDSCRFKTWASGYSISSQRFDQLILVYFGFVMFGFEVAGWFLSWPEADSSDEQEKEDFFAFDHRSIAGTCRTCIVAMGCWMLAIWAQTQTGCVAKNDQISNMSQLEMHLFDVKTTNVISLAAWLCWCLLTHFQTNTDKPTSWLVDAER